MNIDVMTTNPEQAIKTDAIGTVLVNVIGSGTADPFLKRSKTSILLDLGKGDIVLIDTGSKRILEGVSEVLDVSRVYLSHWHHDHTAHLRNYFKRLEKQKSSSLPEVHLPKAPFNILMRNTIIYWCMVCFIFASLLTSLILIFFTNLPIVPILEVLILVTILFGIGVYWSHRYLIPIRLVSQFHGFDLGDLNSTDSKDMKPLHTLETSETKVYVTAVDHTSSIIVYHWPCVTAGYAFEQGQTSIIIATDTKSGCQNLIELSKKATALFHDCTFNEGKRQRRRAKASGHSTPSGAGADAKAANVKYLILTHVSDRRVKDTEQFRASAQVSGYNGEVHLAEDGKEFPFKDGHLVQSSC